MRKSDLPNVSRLGCINIVTIWLFRVPHVEDTPVFNTCPDSDALIVLIPLG